MSARQLLRAVVWTSLLAAAHAPQRAEADPSDVTARVNARFAALTDAELQRLDREERQTQPSSSLPTAAVRARYEALAPIRADATRTASIPIAADALEPDDPSGATAVRRLAGAIKTDPDGTEAGVVLAPFMLAGTQSLRGLELGIASLEADATRFTTSYTWSRDAMLEEADIARIARCPMVEPAKASIDSARAFFVPACVGVIAADSQAPASARAACGLEEPPVASLSLALETVATAVVTIADHGDAATEPLADALLLREQARAIQKDWMLPTLYSCHTASGDAQWIEDLLWSKAKTRLALSASTDRFPRKFGFSPDGSPLPHGEQAAWEVRVDFSRVKGTVELAIGAGLTATRSAPGDEIAKTLGPSFALARAFSLLKRQPLETNGRLNRNEDGEPPPRLVLGMIVSLDLALDLPETQTTRVSSVKLQPHLDFAINKTLSFRLGVPIRGEIAERAAAPATTSAPAVPGRRSLQWTIPVSIVTVLKL